MAKKPGGTKVPETTGELKDPNATPCPKCQAIDALTWYSQELGEQMRGCVKCKYQNTVELWDSLSLKNECEAIANEMDPDLDTPAESDNDDLSDMALHESREIVSSKGEIIVVTCVPGGWIYRFEANDLTSATFVPDPNRMHYVINNY